MTGVPSRLWYTTCDVVNASALDEGWFFRIEPADAGAVAALMDEAAYAAYVETL